jgi:hypothetical protein
LRKEFQLQVKKTAILKTRMIKQGVEGVPREEMLQIIGGKTSCKELTWKIMKERGIQH